MKVKILFLKLQKHKILGTFLIRQLKLKANIMKREDSPLCRGAFSLCFSSFHAHPLYSLYVLLISGKCVYTCDILSKLWILYCTDAFISMIQMYHSFNINCLNMLKQHCKYCKGSNKKKSNKTALFSPSLKIAQSQ